MTVPSAEPEYLHMETPLPEESMHTPKCRRRRPAFDYYDVRDFIRTLGFLAGLAGLIMGDIWLAGKI